MVMIPPYLLLVFFLLTAHNSVDESDLSARRARATGLASSSLYCTYIRRVRLQTFLPAFLREIKMAAAAG